MVIGQALFPLLVARSGSKPSTNRKRVVHKTVTIIETELGGIIQINSTRLVVPLRSDVSDTLLPCASRGGSTIHTELVTLLICREVRTILATGRILVVDIWESQRVNAGAGSKTAGAHSAARTVDSRAVESVPCLLYISV